MIQGEPLRLDHPLPVPVREYEISLTQFDNGMYGAFVGVKGDEYGYGCGQITKELAVSFIVERLANGPA